MLGVEGFAVDGGADEDAEDDPLEADGAAAVDEQFGAKGLPLSSTATRFSSEPPLACHKTKLPAS